MEQILFWRIQICLMWLMTRYLLTILDERSLQAMSLHCGKPIVREVESMQPAYCKRWREILVRRETKMMGSVGPGCNGQWSGPFVPPLTVFNLQTCRSKYLGRLEKNEIRLLSLLVERGSPQLSFIWGLILVKLRFAPRLLEV